MPRPFPAEFRARAIALVRAGKPISRVAAELGISQSCLHNWVRQDLIDRGELANAMFDYIEIFYNRQRRHPQLGYRTPIEFELTYDNQLIPA